MMITANVVNRIYKIMYNGHTGSIFTVEADNKQYIITAKHLVENITIQLRSKFTMMVNGKILNWTLSAIAPIISILVFSLQIFN